jgi:hypothetical protein
MTARQAPAGAGVGRVRQGDVLDAAVIRRARPEAKFQKTVTALLDLYHWRWHHEVDSRKSKRGLPDLIAVRRPRLIFAELKSARGVLTQDQVEWIKQLTDVQGIEVYYWKPSDMDEIEMVLR